MPTTNAKIEKLSRALFPRHGIKDVASLILTAVKNRGRDGHVKIWRPGGGWAWFASPGSTVVTPSLVSLRFPADIYRDAAHAREDAYRQLEDASLSVMTEDEMEEAIRRHATPTRARPAQKKTAGQIEREIAEALAGSASE